MKTALVTGGGSGIGREFVRLFARQNYQIVVFSLVQDELDALQTELERSLSPEHIHLFQLDLSRPNASADVVEVCEAKGLEIDILVNNAGFALWGECVEQDPDKLNAMMQLNIVALTELSQQFGRKMKARRGGKILNVGSTLGVSPVPVAAVYGATKAYVNSFSVALALELAPYGVEVCVVEPFLTKTNFLTYSLQNSPTRLDAQRQDESIARANKLAHSPEMVARAAYEGLMKGKTIIMPGALIRLIFWFNRVRSQKSVAKTFYKFFGKDYL
ncbi:MAG: SDR family oxidoreductase [Pseudomonadota bacterium]